MKTFDLHIIDIVHNSIRAGATAILIEIVDKVSANLFSCRIVDNGKGMSSETVAAINDSFYSSRKERKIGMGIALLKYHAELANGTFAIKSKVGEGTEVVATFQRDHVDRQPVGDLPDCFANFLCQYPNINFTVKHISDDHDFEISTKDILEVFDNIDINNYKIIQNVKELIAENIA